MLQSSGKLRKSIRVEPSIYQAWVPPFFNEPNREDEVEISFKRVSFMKLFKLFTLIIKLYKPYLIFF